MRSKHAKKRQIKSDPLYNSPLVTRLINRIMKRGKKSVAENIVYGALRRLDDERMGALKILEKAVANVSPREEVRPRRVGGATYQVPMSVKRNRSTTLAIRWIIKAAQERKGMPMVEKLARELKAAAQGEGAAVAKKEEVHRLAESNRAFAHFRW